MFRPSKSLPPPPPESDAVEMVIEGGRTLKNLADVAGPVKRDPLGFLVDGLKFAYHSSRPEGRTVQERAALGLLIRDDAVDIGLGIIGLAVPAFSKAVAAVELFGTARKYLFPEAYRAAQEKALDAAVTALRDQEVQWAIFEAVAALDRGGPGMADTLESIVERFESRTGDPGELLQGIREEIAQHGYTGGMSEEPDPPEASFEPPEEPNASSDRSAGEDRDDFLPPDGPVASYPPGDEPNASYGSDASLPPSHDGALDGAQPPLVAPDASR